MKKPLKRDEALIAQGMLFVHKAIETGEFDGLLRGMSYSEEEVAVFHARYQRLMRNDATLYEEESIIPRLKRIAGKLPVPEIEPAPGNEPAQGRTVM